MPGTVDVSDYRAVRRMARQFSADLHRELKRGLKVAGQIGVDAVRRKIDSVPAGRTANTRRARGSLRATMKRNTRVQVRARDVRIIQGARGITGRGARGLPRRLNQQQPFTHPLFGLPGTSVGQQPWRHFDEPLRTARPDMTEPMEAALRRAVEQMGD